MSRRKKIYRLDLDSYYVIHFDVKDPNVLRATLVDYYDTSEEPAPLEVNSTIYLWWSDPEFTHSQFANLPRCWMLG